MPNRISPLLSEVSLLIKSEIPQILIRRYDVTWKSDGSPVTAADIYMEKLLTLFLSERIPGVQIIGEETWKHGSDYEGAWCAVLDPIDGTENFCSGLKEWGVSLSVWQHNSHVGSILMMPELNEVMFTGEIPLISRSRITGFSSSYHPDIGAELADVPEGRITGCAVYNLYNVIRGAFTRFVNPKGARTWDLLAGVSLAREAGCDVVVNDRVYNGQFLRPDEHYRVDIRHRYDLHPR